MCVCVSVCIYDKIGKYYNVQSSAQQRTRDHEYVAVLFKHT